MNLPEMHINVRRDLRDETPQTAIPTNIDDCDLIWLPEGIGNACTLSTADKQQGVAAMRSDIGAGHGTGLVAYRNISSLDLRGYNLLRFWIKCSALQAAGDLQLLLDNNYGCASPVKSLDIPALAVGTWLDHQIVLEDTSALSAIISVGLSVAVDTGAITVWLDHIRAYTNAYKWSDNEIDRHIARALKELSYFVPLEDFTDVATEEGSHYIDISDQTGWIRPFAVEYPIGEHPANYQRFSLWKDQITLLGEPIPDGSDARIYHGRLHTLDAETSTLPVYMEDILSIGAQGYAMEAYASYGIDRSQPDYRYPQAAAREQATLLLSEFRKQLRKLGRMGRVRPTLLYSPAIEPSNLTVTRPHG